MRKCLVCNGTGNLHGTPPLIETGGLDDSKKKNIRSDIPVNSFGTWVMCWQCVGKGFIPGIEQDGGETNDFA